MTELKFYIKAKKHFENKKIINKHGKYPLALCRFLNKYKYKFEVDEEKVQRDIYTAVGESWVGHYDKYNFYRNTVYFFNHKSRMAFINKRIKELSA